MSESVCSAPAPVVSVWLALGKVAGRANPGVSLVGQVSYIDLQISPETRTAKARIEVSNPRQDLRLGMLADAAYVVRILHGAQQWP